LALHLNDPGLDIDLVARLSVMSRLPLQRQLKANGITLSAEIIALKRHQAEEYFVVTTKSVVEIATAVGFTASKNFARASKLSKGESSRDYRNNRAGY
jgi:AraC-like DNA-binding protein